MFRIPGESQGDSLAGNVRVPSFAFPSTSTAIDLGYCYQEKGRRMLNGHNQTSNRGPPAGNEEGSKIGGGGGYIFTCLIYQLKTLMVISITIQKNLPL